MRHLPHVSPRHWRLPVLVLLIGLLAGCAPIYGTEHRYTPPESAEGRACIALCRNTQQMCRSSAENRADREQLRCEVEANRDYERCLRLARGDDARLRCHPRSCPSYLPHDARCTTEFNACYRDCGGEVESEQVCRYNCP